MVPATPESSDRGASPLTKFAPAGMDSAGTGHLSPMDDEDQELERRRPSTNHPWNGERRPLVTPILAVIGVVVLVAVVVALLTWARYNT